MRRGCLYLVAIMDWATRKVLAWRLSNTMDADFCVAALEEALSRFGKPEIFNTDQAASSLRWLSPACCGMPRCGSAWTDAGAGWTMSSSSACGAPSNMNASICTPSRPDRSAHWPWPLNHLLQHAATALGTSRANPGRCLWTDRRFRSWGHNDNRDWLNSAAKLSKKAEPPQHHLT